MLRMRVLGVWLLLLSAWSFAEARQVFVGVFREGAPRNMNYITQFAAQAGKKPAMIMWYQDWAQAFPKEDVEKVVAYGAVPHIVWEPWYWGDGETVKLKDIINGKWDSYIRSWAQAGAAFGSPLFLRVGHEFNIQNYPWGIVNNDKDPQIYIKAFRHIVDIFRSEKADNVKWVWSPMNYSYPDEAWNDWVAAYPGNNYVDWIGFDGYNWGTTQSWSDWQALKYLFRDQMRRAKRLWPDKPIMIAEFAAAEQGGDKAAWIRELPKYLKTSLREIDAFVWFDHKKETDWRINSTSRALTAFKDILSDPLFSSSGPALAALVAPAEKMVKRQARVLRAAKEIKIDGNLADWNLAAPITMKDATFFKEGLNWNGPSDLSGNAYLMWDDNFFYLAAEISDLIPLINKKHNQDIWNGDGFEVVLSVDPAADPKREDFGRRDYQLGFGTGDGGANKPLIWSWQRHRMPMASEISVEKRRQGYVLEAKIPWKFFGDFRPSAGMGLGFDIAFDDADRTGEREKQLIWNGDYYFYKDPSVWGTIEFK